LVDNEALLELLRSHSFYDDAPCSVVGFDPTKLKILTKDPKPKPIRSVGSAEVKRVFSDLSQFIRKSDQQCEADCEGLRPIEPYWDERLKSDRATRVRFIKQLARLGLVGFRRRIRSRVGIFFVAKKGDQIRMVVDARATNRTHHAPPHAALGTPAAIAELDMAPDTLVENGFSASDAASAEAWGAGVDLCDSFYQLEDDELADDFGFDFPDSAGTYGTDVVWEKGEYVAVGSDETVFPVFRGLPMGWSWAL
jgi:hypothetical protein